MTRREELHARARLLRAAVGFALVLPTEPELRVLPVVGLLARRRGRGDGDEQAGRLPASEQHRRRDIARDVLTRRDEARRADETTHL